MEHIQIDVKGFKAPFDFYQFVFYLYYTLCRDASISMNYSIRIIISRKVKRRLDNHIKGVGSVYS